MRLIIYLLRSKFFFGLNFSNQIDFCFPLSEIMTMHLIKREIKIN